MNWIKDFVLRQKDECEHVASKIGVYLLKATQQNFTLARKELEFVSAEDLTVIDNS